MRRLYTYDSFQFDRQARVFALLNPISKPLMRQKNAQATIAAR